MTVFWASPTGNNTISGTLIDSATDAAGDDPGAYGTIGRCAELVSAGDKINVKAGTYTSSSNHAINTAVRHASTFPSGTNDSTRTIVQGAPGGATPVIQVPNWYTTYDGFTRDYITVQNIIVDGQDETDTGGACFQIAGEHQRILNVEIREAYSSAIFVRRTTLGTQFTEILNCVMTGYGRDGNGYGVYGTGDDTTVAGCEMYDAKGGGMQIYADDWAVNSPIIYGNYIHDIALSTQSGFEDNAFGIVVNGADALVYNNILDGTASAGGVGSGITGGYRASNVLLAYNNLIINWPTYGIEVGIFVGTAGNESKNNIILGNVGSGNTANGQIHIHNSSGHTAATNKTTGSLTDYVVSSSDFHLKAGSACIDAGTDLSGIVDDDFDGNARPNGEDYDIGPYEFQNTPVFTRFIFGSH